MVPNATAIVSLIGIRNKSCAFRTLVFTERVPTVCRTGVNSNQIKISRCIATDLNDICNGHLNKYNI